MNYTATSTASFFPQSAPLEWEIVSTATCGRSCCWLSWREWSCSTSCRSCWLSRLRRSTHWWEWRTRLHTAHGTSHSVRIYALDVPSTHAVKPATLIFVSIQIKGYQKFLTTLNVELSKTFGTENIEAQLLRILLMSLDYERLSLPLTSCRNAASFRQNGNNLSL